MHELGQLLDEEMSAEDRAELQAAEEICREFLAWDLATGDAEDDRIEEPKQRLKAILRKTDEDQTQGWS